jgi:hypothetical protein
MVLFSERIESSTQPREEQPFLVPLASAIADNLECSGLKSAEIISTINRTISGSEIDPTLARLSELLLKDILKNELAKTTKQLKVSIKQQDTLRQTTELNAQSGISTLTTMTPRKRSTFPRNGCGYRFRFQHFSSTLLTCLLYPNCAESGHAC